MASFESQSTPTAVHGLMEHPIVKTRKICQFIYEKARQDYTMCLRRHESGNYIASPYLTQYYNEYLVAKTKYEAARDAENKLHLTNESV